MEPKPNSPGSDTAETGPALRAGSLRGTRSQYLISGAILLAFVLLVEWYLGWRELLAPWAELPPLLAGLGLAILLASYGVRSLRFYFYFHERMRGDLLLCTKLAWYHNFFNYVLPMRTGELAFPILMTRYFAIPAGSSLPVLVWFRMLDLHTLILIALSALPLVDLPAAAVLPLALGWLALPWLAYRFNHVLAARLARARSSARRDRFIDVLGSLPQNDRRFFTAWSWTLANWIAKLLVVAAGVVIFTGSPRLAALAAAAAGEVSMVLPVHSAAGAGTYEAAVAAVLVAAAMPLEDALAGAINLHLFLIGGVLVTGMIAILLPAPVRGAVRRDDSP